MYILLSLVPSMGHLEKKKTLKGSSDKKKLKKRLSKKKSSNKKTKLFSFNLSREKKIRRREEEQQQQQQLLVKFQRTCFLLCLLIGHVWTCSQNSLQKQARAQSKYLEREVWPNCARTKKREGWGAINNKSPVTSQ